MRTLKLKVKKRFRDKYSGKMNNAGSTLTVKEDRYREIQRSGDYVEVVNTEAKKPEVKKESK